MADRSLGFIGTTIAGVLSTVAGAAILGALGYFPVVWSWAISAVAKGWQWFVSPLQIPAWGFLALCSYAVVATLARASVPKPMPLPHPVPAAAEQNAKDRFTPDEHLVLETLARADGEWLNFEVVANSTGGPKLVVERAVERLMQKGFLIDRHNVVHGTSIRLSSAGRDYVIESGLVSAGRING